MRLELPNNAPLQTRPILKEARKNHKVIILRNGLLQPVMLPQKPHTLLGGKVDSEMLRPHALRSEHAVEEAASEAAPLLRLVHVEVEDAERRHLVVLALSVEDEQPLLAHFEQSYEASGRCRWAFGGVGRCGRGFHQVEAVLLVLGEFAVAGDDLAKTLGLFRGAIFIAI